MLEAVTIWGVAALVAFVAFGILSAEMDSALLATGTLVAGVLVANFLFGIPVLAAIVANPLWAVVIVLGFLVAGALYTAVWRWPAYIRDHSVQINKSYDTWARRREETEDNSFEAFLDSYEYEFNAWDHKERLATWVGMWPFSLFWELSRKPAIWVWETAYSSLGNTFQRIGRAQARRIHGRR